MGFFGVIAFSLVLEFRGLLPPVNEIRSGGVYHWT